jgi:hypothetical protein
MLAPILSRCDDSGAVNRVINAPEVRPFVGGEGVLDVTPVLTNPLNVALMGEHGGFLFTWSSPRVFEVHTFILASGRGDWARSAARDAIAQMKAIGATELWTRILPEQGNVIAFAEEMGMRPTGEEIGHYGVYVMEIG